MFCGVAVNFIGVFYGTATIIISPALRDAQTGSQYNHTPICNRSSLWNHLFFLPESPFSLSVYPKLSSPDTIASVSNRGVNLIRQSMMDSEHKNHYTVPLKNVLCTFWCCQVSQNKRFIAEESYDYFSLIISNTDEKTEMDMLRKCQREKFTSIPENSCFMGGNSAM